MASIQILPSALSDQIAAGEVVERPSSVAKELLENALDAGATRITVDFEEGGVKKLRIVDNGCGMTPDDAVLSIRRHATSKIYTLADLASIGTLGFRGEALASIASVSKFRIRTKREGCLSATHVTVSGGADPVVSETGGPVGTEIVVEDLFYNVPARLKFLKKPQTESTHIVETVQRLSLCYPSIAFKVIRDGRTVLDLPIHDTLSERLEEMFPRSLTSGLKSISIPGAFGVSGVIGKPQDARGSTRHYYLFVNGRIVKDRVMMSAIQSGCGHLLAKGKHPFAVISLTLPSQAVDVNVHPAKTEVRFADSRQIYRLIARAVEAALTRSEPLERTLNNPTAPLSSLQIKRIVDAQDDGGKRDLETQPHKEPTGLLSQKRRVFDAMARLARKQHAQAASTGSHQANEPEVESVGHREAIQKPRLEPIHGDSEMKIEARGKHSGTTSQPAFGGGADAAPSLNEATLVAEPISKLDVVAEQMRNDAESSVFSSAQQTCFETNMVWKSAFLGARDGVALFEFNDGLKLLDVALLNRRIYEHRIGSGAFSFVAMKSPVLLDFVSPERASVVLEIMNETGIDGELFGQSTLRVTGGDSSIMVAGLDQKVLTECVETFGDVSQARRSLGKIASNVSANEWEKVLTLSPSESFTNAAITSLQSRVGK